MPTDEPRSFSVGRKWTISLNVAIASLALLAIVAMLNYLGARHFYRLPVSGKAQTIFSPLTRTVLGSITNDVHVVVYFDRGEPIYDSVWSLLKEYTYANSRIMLQAVDPDKDPAAAEVLKYKYKLSGRNVVLFDCKGQRKVISESELSDVDVNSMMSGKTKEIKRTHFKGELMFTSALMNVTTPQSLKAYFLQDHGEHAPAGPAGEDKTGYSKFVDILDENNVKHDVLSGLYGPNEIPADCHLLIIAGAKDTLKQEELDKIEKYLKQGGRLFVLFSFYSLENAKKSNGLEKLLANWGVEVGRDVVTDGEHSMNAGRDIVLSKFANHPLVRPLNQSRGIYMVYPRSLARSGSRSSAADAPQVEELVFTGPKGRSITDIRKNLECYPNPSDFIGSVPLMVAVERYSLKGVKDRGSTRILAVGDSFMLENDAIGNFANLEFASHAVNWLLARNELLVNLAPRPIKDYKLNMTESQRASAGWILLAGMPGGVLLIGSMVWLRRRS